MAQPLPAIDSAAGPADSGGAGTEAAADFQPPLELTTLATAAATPAAAAGDNDLFVWFEDTVGLADGGPGIAGLPECLLPRPRPGHWLARVIARRYADGHWHLLSAVRLRCGGQTSAYIAAVYLAALTAGTVALIGTGPQYAQVWDEAYG